MVSALRRLHPTPRDPIAPRQAYDVPRPSPPPTAAGRRPWVGVCMIASLDGAVAVDGKSGPLGNPNDLAVLLALRELADVVMVGAGTARGEGYGPPRKPGLRIGVVTNSGAVDLTTALFTSRAGFLIAPDSAPIDESAVDVVRAGSERVELGLALSRLDALVPDVRFVQVEGGPTLNAGLLADDLVDELDLTISPHLVGDDSARVTHGAPPVDARFALAHLLIDDDSFVFGRWVRDRSR